MKKMKVIGWVPILALCVLFLGNGAAMAAEAHPMTVVGQDPYKAGCIQDASVVPQVQMMADLPPLTLFGFTILQPVHGEQTFSSSKSIQDGNGTVLGTITLFQSKKCGGYFGEVSVAGNPMTIQATSISGTVTYTSPNITDNMIYSPVITSHGAKVCAQGNIQEGDTTFIESACTSSNKELYPDLYN